MFDGVNYDYSQENQHIAQDSLALEIAREIFESIQTICLEAKKLFREGKPNPVMDHIGFLQEWFTCCKKIPKLEKIGLPPTGRQVTQDVFNEWCIKQSTQCHQLGMGLLQKPIDQIWLRFVSAHLADLLKPVVAKLRDIFPEGYRGMKEQPLKFQGEQDQDYAKRLEEWNKCRDKRAKHKELLSYERNLLRVAAILLSAANGILADSKSKYVRKNGTKMHPSTFGALTKEEWLELHPEWLELYPEWLELHPKWLEQHPEWFELNPVPVDSETNPQMRPKRGNPNIIHRKLDSIVIQQRARENSIKYRKLSLDIMRYVKRITGIPEDA